MKALILAAGKGTRLRPLSNTTPKHLLPVANKPIMFHALEHVREAAINDIGIVISPEHGVRIQEALTDGSRWGVKITYILQREALGLAHAVSVARHFLGDYPFLLFLGDNFIQGGVKELVSQFQAETPDALLLLKEVTDPTAFGVAEIDISGKAPHRVIQVVEKPEEPKSNLALVGAYVFTPEIHQAIAKIKPSRHSEYEITDAIQKLVTMGKKVRSQILKGWWQDIANMDDLIEANRIILDDFLRRDIKGSVDSESLIAGRVEIKAKASIENSIIRGPVSIAENCQIKNSFIGPFTSIGAKTIIEDSSIEHSVIMGDSHILKTQHLADSFIGLNSEITRQEGSTGTIKLFVGDSARVKL